MKFRSESLFETAQLLLMNQKSMSVIFRYWKYLN